MSAQDVILHPGTITGEIRIMDPDNPTQPLPIQSINVYAIASAGANTYTALADFANTNRYTIVVEAGPWPYRIRVTAYVLRYNNNYFLWDYKPVFVGEGETVSKDFATDAFLDLRMNVAGENVRQVIPSATCAFGPDNAFYLGQNSLLYNPVVIPVPASTGYRPYTVRVMGYLAPDNDTLYPEADTNVVVNAGQTTPVIFNVEPGYIEGTITLVGATLQYGRVYADTTKTATNAGGSASDGLGSSASGQATFRFPCIPAMFPNVWVRCTLQTDKGTYYGQPQQPDVPVGQTAVCNWDFDFSGSIGGKVEITGYPVTYPGSISVRASCPNLGSLNIQAAADGSYEFTGLGAGMWTISPETIFRYDTYDAGISLTRYARYYFTDEKVELPAGGNAADIDFGFTPGFLIGRILSPNSAALPLMYNASVTFRKYGEESPPAISQEQVIAVRGGSGSGPKSALLNEYWAFASPGLWQYHGAQFYFLSNAASGLGFYSSLGVTDRMVPNPQAWNFPPQTVAESGTSEFNPDYQTGMIKVHFGVADGRPLSKPYVSGYYLTNAFGVRDKSVNITGNATSANVVEGIVHLYALPGTYQLTAQAIVSGSTTTFGQPFLVTIDPGDVVETDPDAPEVNITFPPGEYLTCEESVAVTGTVTDASGVASFTINGQAVTLDAQGNFTFTAANLAVGNNTLHLEATDINGKLTSVDRTVIRDGIPLANNDTYTLYDDEVLNVAAPGVLADDTDEDNDTLSVTGHTEPTSGSLTLTANGTLNYTPVQGVGGTYPFTYNITDGKCGTATATVTIVVTVRNQPPVIQATTASVNEDNQLTLTLATDPDDDPLAVTVTAGPDHGTASFSGGVLTYLPALNFNGTDTLAFTVSDGRGGVVSGALTITVLPVNDPPVLSPLSLSAAAITENDSVTLSGSLADPDLGDTHTVSILWSDGSNSTLGLGAGELSFSVAHQYLDDDPTGTPADVYPIAVSVADAGGLSDSGSALLTMNNAAPVIASLTAPIEPVPVSQAPEVIVQFTDVGTLDTHEVTFAWGDGASATQAATGGSASAAHSYALPGVYTVTVTLTDDDTGSVSESTAYVVMYDPTGSFVTGGGWIESPPGAYTPDPTLTGRAHFGFVSRYEKGATVPSGKTDFRFATANLDFHSTTYDWLVVAGMKAKFKGVGTINGAGDYGFMVSASDGNAPGQTDVDRFRIQIWDRATEVKVYDNQLGTDEMADATAAIGGGAIEIHQVK